jgi:hypothetical protein
MAEERDKRGLSVSREACQRDKQLTEFGARLDRDRFGDLVGQEDL